jgi:diguanylate cyclase (GGDEF)-like protein/PAS domain S-box-containing protein
VRIIDFNGKKLLLSVIRDITERKKAEEELRLKEQILDKASDAIILRNHEGKIIYANEEAYRARGYAREEFIGMDIFHLLPAERAKTSEQRMKEVLEKGSITFESVYTCKDRTLVPAEFSMNTIKIGNDIFVLSIIRDITERKKAERELRLKEQILDSAMDSIILRDSEGTIVYANEIAYQSLGYNKEEFIGMNLRQLLVPEEARLIPNRAQDILKNSTIIFESILTRKDGSQMPIEVKASSIESGGKQFFIAVNRDISQRKEMEEYIKQLAYYDTLTGLPNRALFNDRFALALEHAVRYQHMLALMMMDLDHFKDVNDSLGHEAGDSLLKEVASRLVSCMRKIDTVSRMGGDEFVLLMPQMNREEDVVTLVQRMVETFQQPFTIRNNDLIVTFSLGIALYPHDGNDLDSLVRSADIAMYQVKNRGRHGYLRYTPDMGIKDTVQ